jgi:hypothetical protein
MYNKLLVVTNNKIIYDAMENRNLFIAIDFNDCSLLEILNMAKRRIKNGYVLLVHPFLGSLAPGEQPYKTLLLTESRQTIDFDSLRLIEHCISQINSSAKPPAVWTKQDLAEFAKIDVMIVERWLRKVYYRHA